MVFLSHLQDEVRLLVGRLRLMSTLRPKVSEVAELRLCTV